MKIGITVYLKKGGKHDHKRNVHKQQRRLGNAERSIRKTE